MLVGLYAARHLTRVHWNVSHLIRVRLKCTESQKVKLIHHRAFTSPHNMASLDIITKSLESLSIKPRALVSHETTTSPTTWRQALLATESAPKSFELIKTLVYKPKTAKTATPVPVVVIARDETETNSGAIGRTLNLKELRLASGDLLTEFFALDKDSRMSLTHLNMIVLSGLNYSVSSCFEQRRIRQSFDRRRRIDRIFIFCLCYSCTLFKLYHLPLRIRYHLLSSNTGDGRCQAPSTGRREHSWRPRRRRCTGIQSSCQRERRGQDRGRCPDRYWRKEGSRFRCMVYKRNSARSSSKRLLINEIRSSSKRTCSTIIASADVTSSNLGLTAFGNKFKVILKICIFPSVFTHTRFRVVQCANQGDGRPELLLPHVYFGKSLRTGEGPY